MPAPIIKTQVYLYNRPLLSRHYRRKLRDALQEVRDSGVAHRFCEMDLDDAFVWDHTPQGWAFWSDMEARAMGYV